MISVWRCDWGRCHYVISRQPMTCCRHQQWTIPCRNAPRCDPSQMVHHVVLQGFIPFGASAYFCWVCPSLPPSFLPSLRSWSGALANCKTGMCVA